MIGSFLGARGGRPRDVTVGTATVTVLVLLFGGCGTATVADGRAQSEQVSAPRTVEAPPIVGVGDLKYPGNNLTDWVTYADYVAIVRVASEARGEPQFEGDSKTEYVLPRTMELSIADVLWTKSTPLETLPGSIEYPALGDHVSVADDGTLTIAEFVASGSSRIESGHEYLMPLYWDDECVRLGPTWSSLDPVPFDTGVAGVGEFEGRERTLAEATKQPADATNRDLPIFALAGLTADQVRDRLVTIPPDPKPFVPAC